MRLSVTLLKTTWQGGVLALVLLIATVTVSSAEPPPVPEDESGILDNGNPVAVSSDTSDLAGTWGKCLKSVDTRCYYMSLEAQGGASILTYISTRDTQFGDDPADKPYCYSVTQRELARLGRYTYIWRDHLASSPNVDPAGLMKIVVLDNALLVYSGDKLQLSLPAVAKDESEKLVTC